MNDKTLERVRFRAEPLANPLNVVHSGRARFTILAPRLLRLEWSETGQWEDRATYAFPTRCGPPVPYESRIEGDLLILDTGSLRLSYRPEGKFSEENLSVAVFAGGVHQTPGGAARHQDLVCMPGQPASSNLRGTRRTLDKCAGDATLEAGLLSRSGWSVLDDSESVVFAADGWPAPRPEHDLQDWYFFGFGHDYKAALATYVVFGGSIPLVPRFVLGAWWSRYWAYSDQELKELVQEFEEHDLPLDVLVLDMDWHTPHTWTGYTWNRELFPDPPGFLRWVHEKGLRVTLNLHPAQGVQPFEEAYPRFARAMGLDPDSGVAIPFRITDKRFVKNYLELLHRPLEEDGVDFWWMDWQQGVTSEIRGLDPLKWLNHLHFWDSGRRGSRPLLYSRWAGLGNHRYPIGFSGDTYATWQALQFQPYMTATASNVAYGWWSHDIGGHMGGATEPELFARWVQFGALSPCLRLHATKDPLAERRPWKYPEKVLHAVREAFHLRYRLVPYLYTMARVAHDTGVSICRPVYYEHPQEDAAYVARYQYFLGDQVLAAPMVFPADPSTGLAAIDVWVPEGTWIDYQTRETFVGPRWVRLLGDLSRLPMLVKAGAILPLGSKSATGQERHDKLVLSLFPGADGAFRLYEDDGTTEAYKVGQYEWTNIRTRMVGAASWVVEIDPVEGFCQSLPSRRSYEIRLEGSQPPSQVTIDGQATNWAHEADSHTTIIQVLERDKQRPVVVCATADSGISALSELHNQTLVRRDILRLLGDEPPEDPLDVGSVLKHGGPGSRDAVARLGGPLVSFVEYVTPDEASQQLGRVIIGAPAGLDPDYTAEIVFWQTVGGEAHSYRALLEHVSQSCVIATPFRYGGRLAPCQWGAEVMLSWRGESLSYAYRSSPLFPTVPTWRVVVFNQDEEPIPLSNVLAGETDLNGALDWRIYQQEAGLPLANLTEGYEVNLERDYAHRLGEGEPLAGYLATVVTSPDVRRAVLVVRAECRTEWYLNGQRVELQPDQEHSVPYPPFYRPTRRSIALGLRQGTNSLVASSLPSESVHHSTGQPLWRFGAALVSPDGQVMPDLTFE